MKTNLLVLGFDMNLEEAIRWYAKKRNKEDRENPKLQKEYKGDMKATLERVNAEKEKEVKKVQQELADQQKQFEIDKRSWSYPYYPDEMLRAGFQSNNELSGRSKIAMKDLRTISAMTYSTAFASSGIIPTYNDVELYRRQMEEEYKIKLKTEVERIKREMRGEDGQQVEIDILAKGRKFKLDGE